LEILKLGSQEEITEKLKELNEKLTNLNEEITDLETPEAKAS